MLYSPELQGNTLTLGQQAVFVTLTAGVAKAAPHVSPERIKIFPCGFHQSVGNHKHILSDVSSTKTKATPTKIKIEAAGPDINGMS